MRRKFAFGMPDNEDNNIDTLSEYVIMTLIYGKNQQVNTPQCHIIHTLPVLSNFMADHFL